MTMELFTFKFGHLPTKEDVLDLLLFIMALLMAVVKRLTAKKKIDSGVSLPISSV